MKQLLSITMKSYFYALAAVIAILSNPVKASNELADQFTWDDTSFAPEGHKIRVSCVEVSGKKSKRFSYVAITLPKEEQVTVKVRNKRTSIDDGYSVAGLEDFKVKLLFLNAKKKVGKSIHELSFVAVPKEGKTMGDVEAIRIEFDLKQQSYRALVSYYTRSDLLKGFH